MCSEWFELVEKAKLSNEQTEQLTITAQAQFKVINWLLILYMIYEISRCFFCSEALIILLRQHLCS